MGQDPGFAAVQVNLFEGTCYLTPLLGAWLADGLWGRYKTILIFSAFYFLGMLLLSFTAAIPGLTPATGDDATAFQSALLYSSLYLVALASGGIKPNVSPFGAEQFSDSDPRDKREKKSFFNWFYFFVNIGSLLAVTVVVWVQENIGWAIGFAIPAGCMAIAIMLFIAGSPLYKHTLPTESPLSRVFNVVWSAYKRRHLKEDPQDVEGLTTPLLVSSHAGTGIPRNESLQWLNQAINAPTPAVTPAAATASSPRLRTFTAAQVEEVKLVLRMLPVFFTTILYWSVYMQMGSFFVEQGYFMDRTFDLPNHQQFTIPAASLAMVNTLAIVILIPVYDRLLIPMLRKLNMKITLLQRIGWGLAVCIFSMLAAAFVERKRLDLDAEGHLLSVWWQTPQYLLVGLSEVFTSIGQMEFFYDQAPDVMRSCSMALQLLSVALGSYLSGALVWGAGRLTASFDRHREGWLPKDINKGRLDLFFLLLALLMAMNLAWFLWVAVNYEYKKEEQVRPSQAATSPMRPPLPPRRQQTAPMASLRASRAHPHATAAESPGSVSPAMYGRSVTFFPQTPALPAPFR